MGGSGADISLLKSLALTFTNCSLFPCNTPVPEWEGLQCGAGFKSHSRCNQGLSFPTNTVRRVS